MTLLPIERDAAGGVIMNRTTLGRAVALRDASGAQLEAARKAELLAAARAGHVDPIAFDARVYRQKRGEPLTPGVRSMQNYIQIRPGGMRAHARSYRGAPFLAAHDISDPRARAGQMADSWLDVGGDTEDDEMIIRHAVDVVAPWAVAGVLDGTIDRFSIHYGITGDIVCSVHGKPVFSKCYCLPGRFVEGSDENDPNRPRVFWIVTNAVGRETSTVNVPAVGNGATGIEAVRFDVGGTTIGDGRALDLVGVEVLAGLAGATAAQFREALAVPGPTVYDVPNRTTITGGIPAMSFTRLAAALGITLAAGATLTEDQALGAVDGLKAERDALRGRAETAEGMVKLAADKARTTAIDGHIAAAYAAGKLLHKRDDKGAQAPDPQEANLRKLGGALGAAELKVHLDAMPARGPATALQSERVESPPEPGTMSTELAAAMAAVQAAGGFTDAEMAAARRDLEIGTVL